MTSRSRGTIAICLILTVLVTNGWMKSSDAAVQNCVPGELIVSFVEKEVPVVSARASMINSIYPTLNNALEEFRLSSTKSLFCSKSPLKNVFLFEFPLDVDLNAVSVSISEMPFIEAVERNLLLEVTLDIIPTNYACRQDWY